MLGFDLIIGLLLGGIRRGGPEAKKKPTPPNTSVFGGVGLLFNGPSGGNRRAALYLVFQLL
jgi:hypothetical protein